MFILNINNIVSDIGEGGVSYMYDMLYKRGPIPRWETKLLNQKLNYQKWNNDRYNKYTAENWILVVKKLT